MATSDNPFAGLTADQILQLIQSGKSGMTATPITAGIGGGQDGYYGPTSTQYDVWDGQNYHPGQMNYAYDASGNYLGSHKSVDPTTNDKLAIASFLAMFGGAAMLGGMGSAGAAGTLGEGWAGGAAGGLGGGAGAAAGGAAAFDPSLAVQGNSINALDGATGVPYSSEIGAAAAPNTAAMGAGPASGLSAATSTGADTAGETLSKAALDGTNSFGANSVGNALDISSLNSASPGLMSDAALSNIAKTLGYNAVPDWLKMALKAGSVLGGGLLGSQPEKTSVQKDLPDYLKPYVTAPGGLLSTADNLMHQQMGYVPQQAQQISNVGMGLLQQPVAGNGFQQFQQRPRFGG